MAKMIGSLQHLGGDRYRIRLYAGTDALGHQRVRSRSFHAPTRARAEKMAPKITAELQAEVDDDKATAGTMAGLVAEWLTLKRGDSSPSSVAGYTTHAKRIVERFGRLAPKDVTTRLIDQWYGDLKKSGMSDANIRHHHATLRMILRQGERYGMVSTVTTRLTSPPKHVDRPHTLPTVAALDVVLSTTSGSLRAALHLLAASGLRRGELVGLQWADLDGRWLNVQRSILELDGGGWLVKTTKTKRSRKIELDNATLLVLLEHLHATEAKAAQVEHAVAVDVPELARGRDRADAVPARLVVWPVGEAAQAARLDRLSAPRPASLARVGVAARRGRSAGGVQATRARGDFDDAQHLHRRTAGQGGPRCGGYRCGDASVGRTLTYPWRCVMTNLRISA